MMAHPKPYPAYKNSGLPWLPMVPAHWELAPTKSLLRLKKQTVGHEHSAYTLLSLTLRGVIPRDMENQKGKFPAEFDTYQSVEPGDLVFCLFDVDETPRAVGLARERGMVTGAYTVFKCVQPSTLSFLYLYFLAMDNEKSFRPLYTGLRKVISKTALLGAKIPMPPHDEQDAIVRFLDHADRRIGRYIRAQQQLVKLLEEQKQITINRAVTQGLGPTVRLKPSSVEWVAEVPEHWNTRRVKNEFACLNARRVPLSATQRGHMTSRQYDYYGASGVIDKVDDFLFDDELLLIAEDGANLVLRNLPLAIIARGKFWVNNHAHILKPRTGNLEFLAYLMESLSYSPWISGAAQPKLTMDRLLSIAIAVPPRTEQDEIVRSLAKQTAPLKTAIGQAKREIDLLREYKTRLIADVVMGRIDVREVAKALPEQELLGEGTSDSALLNGDEDSEDLEEETEEVPA